MARKRPLATVTILPTVHNYLERGVDEAEAILKALDEGEQLVKKRREGLIHSMATKLKAKLKEAK